MFVCAFVGWFAVVPGVCLATAALAVLSIAFSEQLSILCFPTDNDAPAAVSALSVEGFLEERQRRRSAARGCFSQPLAVAFVVVNT